VRTIFNLLGPLTNPAGARRQLVGISDVRFQATMAGALARLGVDRALVVAAEDGLDEVSASAPTNVIEVNGEEIRSFVLRPEDVGLDPSAETGSVKGGTPQQNAAVTRAILEQSHTGGAHPAGEALAVVNAGAAIYAAGRSETIAEGVEMARAALADGHASAALERFVEATRRHAPAGRGR
jgi:anthranilate phosphoribosyltransferase